MEMTTLDELERLLKAGTPRPWTEQGGGIGKFVEGRYEWSDIADVAILPDRDAADGEGRANAALIVAAINALPGLIESARRVEEMRAALKPFAQMADAVDGAKEVEVQITDVDSGESITLVMGTARFLIARAALKGT
jgi:hypothetical protein